jgi:hypothetical protein
MTRLQASEPVVAAKAAARYAQLRSDSELWLVDPVDDAVWARSGRPFPVEPVRLLDALHVATIEKVAGVLDDLLVLSTDRRVRENATTLGFDVAPSGGAPRSG